MFVEGFGAEDGVGGADAGGSFVEGDSLLGGFEFARLRGVGANALLVEHRRAVGVGGGELRAREGGVAEFLEGVEGALLGFEEALVEEGGGHGKAKNEKRKTKVGEHAVDVARGGAWFMWFEAPFCRGCPRSPRGMSGFGIGSKYSRFVWVLKGILSEMRLNTPF